MLMPQHGDVLLASGTSTESDRDEGSRRFGIPIRISRYRWPLLTEGFHMLDPVPGYARPTEMRQSPTLSSAIPRDGSG